MVLCFPQLRTILPTFAGIGSSGSVTVQTGPGGAIMIINMSKNAVYLWEQIAKGDWFHFSTKKVIPKKTDMGGCINPLLGHPRVNDAHVNDFYERTTNYRPNAVAIQWKPNDFQMKTS